MRAREIKFRAWDRRLKIMFNNSEIIIKNSKVTHLKDKEFFSIEYDPIYKVELMQYTGLKDKNGKEIYEGDAVAVRADRLFYISVVEWLWNGYWIKDTQNSKDDESPMYDNPTAFTDDEKQEDRTIEVIGNIYESPELLDN